MRKGFNRAVSFVLVLVLTMSLCSCGSESRVSIDYGDAESFEAALNAGENLEGKIVRFNALELHPKSAVGYNVWAGEHLNFISDRNPDIKAGDTVVVRVDEITSSLGSWFIKYEKVENAEVTDETISAGDTDSNEESAEKQESDMETAPAPESESLKEEKDDVEYYEAVSFEGVHFDVPKTWSKKTNSTGEIEFTVDECAMKVGLLSESITEDGLNSEMFCEVTRSTYSEDPSYRNVTSEARISKNGNSIFLLKCESHYEDEYNPVKVAFVDSDNKVIMFMFMDTSQDDTEKHAVEFDGILDSIKCGSGAIINNTENSSKESAQEVADKLDVKTKVTLDGQIAVFVTNKSNTIIDELDLQINFIDGTGNVIDIDTDGHDMVLPGYTVVSQMDIPSVNFADFQLEYEVSLGEHSRYVNHSEDVVIESNPGNDCVIVKVTNNSDVKIDEIEFDVILYKGDDVATICYPKDVYDVPPGVTKTEKVRVYSAKMRKSLKYGTDYDRIEVYLNQAHTFGF